MASAYIRFPNGRVWVWTKRDGYEVTGADVRPDRMAGTDSCVYITFETPREAYLRMEIRDKGDALAFAEAIKIAAEGE